MCFVDSEKETCHEITTHRMLWCRRVAVNFLMFIVNDRGKEMQKKNIFQFNFSVIEMGRELIKTGTESSKIEGWKKWNNFL